MVKTVKITTDNKIFLVELPNWSISTMGAAIEAEYTEAVKTQRMYDLFQDSIVMIVDESGKVNKKPDNQVASFLYGADQHGYTIAGNVIFGVRRGPDDLPPENPELLKIFLKDHFPVLQEVDEDMTGNKPEEEIMKDGEIKKSIAVVKELNPELINRANNNSMMGTRGKISSHNYKALADKILSWPISEAKKQNLLDKLYKKWSTILNYEAQHVSVIVAGPANYNARKLDKTDRILSLYHDISVWIEGLEEQIKQGQVKDDKAKRLMEMIEFCRKSDNPCNPTNDLAELALYDNQTFIRLYEEMYPEYKWRKNSTIAKLYQKSIAGELKEIRKEIFFEDDNFTAYTEGDRAYIKFVMRPKRQLHVALKSRGWWWNSYQSAYSTYLDRVDKEWIATISTRYAQYI